MQVSVKELAVEFSRDVRTIQYWVEREGMPKESRGMYDLIEVYRWRVKKLDELLEYYKAGGDVRLTDLQKEQVRLNNEIKSIKLAQLQKKVVDIDQVHAAWLMEVKMWVRALEAMPVRITNLVGGDRTTMTRINEIVMELREQIANTPLDLDGVELDEDVQTEQATEEEEITIAPNESEDDGSNL